MVKTKAAAAEVEEVAADTAPEQVGESPEAARARAQRCFEELGAVLGKHRCRIVPHLSAEPVGNDGSRAMVSATYGVVPL